MVNEAVHFARSTWAELRVDLARVAGYRASMALWTLSTVLASVVAMLVWRQVAGPEGRVGDYDARGVVGYFAVSMAWLALVRTTGGSHHLPHDVRIGRLPGRLLRPVHPLAHYVARNLTSGAMALAVVVPVAAATYLVLDGSGARPAALLPLVAVLPLAYGASFLLGALVGCTSFRTVRTEGAEQLLHVAVLLLGGRFVPVSALPGPVEDVARALPFSWIFAWPVELATGTVPLADAWTGIAVLGGWFVAAWIALRVVWRRALRAHEAVGG